MRLAAQAKCGFYPAPAEAVALAAKCLRPPAEGTCAILDPCCGKGVAIQQLAYALPGAVPWAIELDEKRSIDATQNLAAVKGNFLGPASFFGTSITPAHNAFGFIWLNPPFDDEIGGGGRIEYSFLMRATTWLRPEGVLALVCPENVAMRWEMQRYLLQWYGHLSMLPFPDGHRRFNEVVVLAVKRAKPVDWRKLEWWDEVSLKPRVYQLPVCGGPRAITKFEMTDAEMSKALGRSPLLRLLEPPQPRPIPQPPLPLATGHIALLLAAGHLDGIVRPPNELPHVVRGTARKEKYVAGTEETEDARGNVVTKTTIAEKIVMTVRVAEADGTITTFE